MVLKFVEESFAVFTVLSLIASLFLQNSEKPVNHKSLFFQNFKIFKAFKEGFQGFWF